MDKNSLIGIILILGVLIGWSVWMTPSKEELAQQRHIQDSINKVNRERFVRDSISMAEAMAVMNATSENQKHRIHYGHHARCRFLCSAHRYRLYLLCLMLQGVPS